MKPQLSFWDHWHAGHESSYPGGGAHFHLAERALRLLNSSRSGRVLDLGCGQGPDARFFAASGFETIGLDFSRTAIGFANLSTGDLTHESYLLADMAVGLPFKSLTFALVYSHLSLHYFDHIKTRRLISEIMRVLIPGGWLVASVKSTADSRYGQGTLLSSDVFNYHGHIRHFFSRQYAEQLLRGFCDAAVDESFGDYDGRASAFLELVGRKPS